MKILLAFNVILICMVITGMTIQHSVSNLAKNSIDGDEVLKDNINNIVVKDMEGKEVNLSSYNGKVLLVVNVASYCGYTKQYKGLEEIYRKYKADGFEILAFPCNDFGSQEPGSNEEIINFCSANYDVTFKLFDKISVKGKDKSPLYEVLTNNSITGTSDIGWNFEKFLIDRDGKIIARYKSKVEPTNEKLIGEIEKQLSLKKDE